MLINIVVGEIMFSQKPLEKISLEDIQSALDKIQSCEFSAPLSPLGDLKNLAEKIQPAIEGKIQQILAESKRTGSSTVSSAKSLAPEQKIFSGKEFGLAPKRTGEEMHQGFTEARRRLMSESLRRRRREN